MARRDNPHARCTTEIPPKPKLTASLAARIRRVRSSKSGHTERNFCINSDRVLMLRKHTTITHKLIPLFIYTALGYSIEPPHEAPVDILHGDETEILLVRYPSPDSGALQSLIQCMSGQNGDVTL